MTDVPTLDESEHVIQNPSFQFQVARLGQIALQTENLSDFFDIVVESVSKTLEAEFCKILELIPEREELLLISGVGWNDGIVGTIRVKTKDNSQAGYTLLSDKPVIVQDLEHETRFHGPDLLLSHNVVSGISVTIKGKGDIYGVIGVHSKRKKKYGEEHANFLLSVSYILSSAIIQHKSIEKLKESEERFRSIVENASDAIFLSDINFNYTQVNSKASELTGYSKEELLSMNILDLMVKEEVKRTPVPLNQFKVGESLVTQRNLISKSGKLIPVEINAKKLSDDTFIGMVRDLTQRKLVEKRLIEESKLTTLMHLSGGIAHDFNNLLNVIVGNLSIAKTIVNDDHELDNILKNISMATERATNITRQLLTFSNEYRPEIEVFDLVKLIDEVISFTFYGSNIRPSIAITKSVHLVKADRGQISQVLQNILINAEQSMQNKKGEIKVQVENRNIGTKNGSTQVMDHVFVSIEDNGEGITSEDLSNIFDPFFTTKEGGKGLGLATSHLIVKNHGGKIEVDSEKGIGTVVKIYLPKYFGETPEKIQVANIGKEMKLNGKILILDDDKMVRKTLEKMLKVLGLDVTSCDDGNDLIKFYKRDFNNSKPFDVTILDLTVPGSIGGYETLQLLKKIDPNVKAIVSSGYSKDFHLKNYKDYGFIEKLPKPYTLEELYRVLNKVLNKIKI